MENTERDEDGFPVLGPESAEALFTDEYGVVWECVQINYEGVVIWAWVHVGKTWFIPEEGDNR